METVILRWSLENGVGLTSIIMMVVIISLVMPKWNKIMKIADSDIDIIDEIKKNRTSIMSLGEQMMTQTDMDKLCAHNHTVHLTKDEIYKQFVTKENHEIGFTGLQKSIDNLADEFRNMRAYLQEVMLKVLR